MVENLDKVKDIIARANRIPVWSLPTAFLGIIGLVVVDGSWNRINTIENLKGKNGKKLPLLLPVNPVNYGKPGKLSSLEALAAALYIMGYSELAENVISKYSWAQNFIKTNIEPLNDYMKCTCDSDCIRVQGYYF